MGKTTDQIKGRIKEAIGSLTGDKRLKREGQTDRVFGEARDKVDGVVDAATDKAGAVAHSVTDKQGDDDETVDASS